MKNRACNPETALADAPTLIINDAVTREAVTASRREFGTLDNYLIGGRKFQGRSPWELHPEKDEFLFVSRGSVDVTLITADGDEHVVLAEGSLLVVPKGTWHQLYASETATFWGITDTRLDQISFEDRPV